MLRSSPVGLWSAAILWVSVALPLVTAQQKTPGMSDEKRLINTLMNKYTAVGTIGRPVLNANDTVTAEKGLSLIQILGLDEKEQTLTIGAWPRFSWRDQYLMWDPKDFGGVKEVRLPPDSVWTPDIVLYNTVDAGFREDRNALLVVSYDGKVLWIPPAIYKSTCPIHVTNFPFDQQICKLKFGSWTHDGFKLDLKIYNDKSAIDLDDYVVSNEWSVIATKAVKNVKYYPCCKEPYPDITFFLEIRRNPSFYVYLLIFPAVLLSILSLVVFWLPPESPAKIVLGMIIFVAFFLLLLLLDNLIPTTSNRLPTIGGYYCLNMVLIMISTFLSLIVINIHFRSDRRNRLPAVIRKVFRVIARVFCIANASVLDGAELSQESSKKADAEKDEQPEDGEEKAPSSVATEDVSEIRKALRVLLARVSAKDAADRVVQEWRVVAVVLDRFFFICYLIIIIIAIILFIPRYNAGNENSVLSGMGR